MQQTNQLLLLLVLSIFCLQCQPNEVKDNRPNEYPIIPLPAKLTPIKGQFKIDSDTRILINEENETIIKTANYLADALTKAVNIKPDISKSEKSKDAISLELDPTIQSDEGYELEISIYDVSIRAKTAQGLFYGIQSLLQLVPTSVDPNKIIIPCVSIKDEPRFPYRGMHLDVGRHFFPTDFIKKYIDLLALHKMNRFHWHLTEDQGWRIEIKKYPKLQEIAAYRKETLIGHYNDQPHQFDGKRYGGFYTQEEIKDIVAYAQDRFITIIPEIELPGHSQAALAAYPELACTSGPFEAATKWGVFDNVYCPTETTFEFLENVLSEVIDLFPSTYIHIGGDECPKIKWKESSFCQQLMKKEKLKDEHELQSYFIKRIERFVLSKNRKIIGWDEILEGGLAPEAAVMSWRGMEGGIKAANEGHDVVMSPTSHCYFDYYQSQSADEPLAIGGFLPLKKVYAFEPIPEELNTDKAKHILGAQGNVWTEYMPTTQQVEYMAFPRASALAEVVWSPKEKRSYANFVKRLQAHMKRLQALEVNVANHIFDVNIDIKASAKTNELLASCISLDSSLQIYYTTDNTKPTTNSILYTTSIPIEKNTTLRVASFKDGEQVGRLTTQQIIVHKAAGKKISLTNPPHSSYDIGGKTALINGVKGSNDRYGDKEWLGFWGEDFEAIIDLQKKEKLTTATMRFFNGNGQWIYLPKKVEIAGSEDGQKFTPITSIKDITSNKKVKELEINLKNTTTRFLKIKAIPHGIIADGKQGAGHEAWLFVDELVVF